MIFGLLVDLGFCEGKDLHVPSSKAFIEGTILFSAKAPGIPGSYSERDEGFVIPYCRIGCFCVISMPLLCVVLIWGCGKYRLLVRLVIWRSFLLYGVHG